MPRCRSSRMSSLEISSEDAFSHWVGMLHACARGGCWQALQGTLWLVWEMDTTCLGGAEARGGVLPRWLKHLMETCP